MKLKKPRIAAGLFGWSRLEAFQQFQSKGMI
jgi:hypothetical protein